MEEYLIWDPTNLKDNLGARLPNAPDSLKYSDARLKFQCKKLEVMNFMIQEHKCGKDKRFRQYTIYKVLMMQGVRPSFSAK
jgi:hypothetical protein